MNYKVDASHRDGRVSLRFARDTDIIYAQGSPLVTGGTSSTKNHQAGRNPRPGSKGGENR
jgi:hypothetical protein